MRPRTTRPLCFATWTAQRTPSIVRGSPFHRALRRAATLIPNASSSVSKPNPNHIARPPAVGRGYQRGWKAETSRSPLRRVTGAVLLLRERLDTLDPFEPERPRPDEDRGAAAVVQLTVQTR